MKDKAFTPKQIIGKLTKEEALLSQEDTVGKVSLKLGIEEQTHYRWKKGYGRDVDGIESKVRCFGLLVPI